MSWPVWMISDQILINVIDSNNGTCLNYKININSNWFAICTEFKKKKKKIVI